MARYQVQAPDGHVVTMEGPDGASDAEVMSQAQALYKPNAAGPQKAGYGFPAVPPAQPVRGSVGMDVANSAMQGANETGRGMVKQAANFAGLPFDPASLLQGVSRGVSKAADAVGLPSVARAADVLGGAPAYKPQTTAGEFAYTAGQIAPAALLAPGSIGQRAANIVVPTLTTEAAGRSAKAMGANEAGVGVARALGGLGGGLLANARITPTRPPVDEAAGMAQANEALQEAGIDIHQVSRASMGRLGDLIRQGRNPREAALSVVATDDLPVPVPLTRGQRTGQPGQQLSENLMLRGARGSAASRQMRGLVSEQQDALRGNTAAIADQVAGTNAPTRGAAGQGISDTINSRYDAAKAGVDAAYQAARDTGPGAVLPREQVPVLGARLRESVAGYDMDNVPRVARELNKFDNIAGSGAVTVRDLFDARTRLSNLRAGTDQVEASAARNATRALDAHIDEAVTGDLLKGDPSSVAAWREAISRRRAFGQMFESGDLIEALTERVPRGGNMRALKVDPGEATNYILGRSDLGFVGKQNLHRDMTRLREVLGPDSTEWNAIRSEAFQRFASQGEGAVEFGARQFSGAKFQKAWTDFNRRDPRLAELLFTPEERATINRFSMISSRVTSPVRGGDNPSNTAVTATRLLGNLSFLKGVPFLKDITNEMEVQVNLRQARAATSQNIGRPARQLPRVTLDSSTTRQLSDPSGPEWRRP